MIVIVLVLLSTSKQGEDFVHDSIDLQKIAERIRAENDEANIVHFDQYILEEK